MCGRCVVGGGQQLDIRIGFTRGAFHKVSKVYQQISEANMFMSDPRGVMFSTPTRFEGNPFLELYRMWQSYHQR